MGTCATVIANAGRVLLGYGRSLLSGIAADRFARLAEPGGRRIESNHPAFAYGHLALYPARMAGWLGLEGIPAVPPRYADLFEAGKPCRDDPGGTIYPPMEEIVSHYLNGYEAILAAVEKLDDAVLARPNPRGGRMAEMFPTVGGMVNFMLTAHAGTHLGQVSAWRRAMGLPPVL